MNTTNATTTPAAQFSQDVNAACPLPEGPGEMGSAEYEEAWACVSGSVRKEYYARSPYATIEAYTRGFVVHNLVVGTQHPVSGWEAAQSLRGDIAARYSMISGGMR